MQPEDIEIQLWDYIDGTCSDADRARISLLVDTDSTWKQLYDEAMATHSTMQTNLAPIPAGNTFTDSVMAQLAPAAKPGMKKLLNLSIKAVACFFIVAVLGLSVYAAAVTDWGFSTSASAIALPKFKFSMPEMNFNISSSGVAVAGFCAVVLVLMMADNFFRGRMPGKL